MNRARKLVASISTLSTRRRTYSPSSSTFRTISIINSQTHHSSRRESFQPSSSSAKPLCLRFSGREFSSGSSDTTSSSVCWNCGSSSEKAAFLFCDSCRSIQPIDDAVDFFQIFDLEKKYELDAGSLEGKYKDWQKKLHPDLVHNKSQKERDYAADQSAKVTEAYRTLTKRLSRAMYIMKLNGKNVNEEETITDPTLLMEIMELRETISEANDSKELDQIRSQVQEKLKQWSDSFVEAFESHRFDEAGKCIQRMTYYERACEEIVKKL
uniref:J domain-containing protein n=1 Tax=Brassica oleracea TaxID=3712 RepID=A0A3P6EDF5_BRAOL|nr:unnamed protein product [Brassica oleracea]